MTYFRRTTSTALYASAVLCVAALFSPSAQAATPPDSCFAFNAGTGTITDYYNNEANNPANPACTREVDIPSTIGGVPVTVIGNNSFYGKRLTGVTFPNTIVTIGGYAFASNYLTAVNVPLSVATIDGNAFRTNNITDATIVNSSAVLQHTIFDVNPIESMTIGATTYEAQTPTENIACFALSGSTITDYYRSSPIVVRDFEVLCGDSVSIPNTITAIGNNAFSSNGLKEVTIPMSVTSLGSGAFYYNQLSTVTVPSSVTNIGLNALRNNQLVTVTLEGDPSTLGLSILEGNPLTSISYNGVLYTDAQPVADSCYAFSGGTITDYRFADLNHIKNNNEACLNPSIVIPSQIGGIPVTALGNDSMRHAFLESVVLPNSVLTIGDRAFMNNRLESITLSSSLTHIDWYAFYGNRLASVTVPDSVVFIEQNAFFLQNPWGSYVTYETIDNAPYIWTSDPQELQQIYDAIWYARLITANPANPNNLQDGIINENYEMGYDANLNGIDDSLGGHLINPAQVEIKYVNQADQDVSVSSIFTGRVSNDSYLSNYLANQGPLLPEITDIMSLTPTEQTALDEALASYYRIGQEVTIEPPAIDGYVTPEPQTFVLGAAENVFSYVYGTDDGTTTSGSAGTSGGGLAATGASLPLIAGAAASIFLASGIAATHSFRRK